VEPFITGLTTWFGIGAAVNVLVILTESCAGLVRGPAWALDFQKECDGLRADAERHKRTVWTWLRPVLWWPPVAAVLWRAYSNKRTCGEQVLAEWREKKETERRAALRDRLVSEGKWPIDFQWQVASKDEGGTAHVRLARFLISLPDGRRIVHGTIAHSVWESPDGKQFICHRVVDQPPVHVPMFVAKSKAEATAWCDADWDWAGLCAPGKETDRRRVGLEQMARLEEGVEK